MKNDLSIIANKVKLEKPFKIKYTNLLKISVFHGLIGLASFAVAL